MPKGNSVSLPLPVQASYLKNKLFGFIDKGALKMNAAYTLQYSYFLSSLEASFSLPGPIRYSLFKNIIVLSASLVESLLSYKLQSLIKSEKVDASYLLGEDIKYEVIAEIYKTTRRQIVAATKKTEPKKVNSETKFIEVNRAAKKCGLLDDSLFKDVEALRGKRNKIHLAGLDYVDDKYDRSDVEDAFHVLKRVRKKIKNFKFKSRKTN